MNSFLVPIGSVKTNPNNPRFIKDEKLSVAKYVESYGDVAVVGFKRATLG